MAVPWDEVAVDLIGPWKIKVKNQTLCQKYLQNVTLLEYTEEDLERIYEQWEQNERDDQGRQRIVQHRGSRSLYQNRQDLKEIRKKC